MSIDYQKYEFCKSVACESLTLDGFCFHSGKHSALCNRTAKEFHHWLKENGFKIFKAESADEVVMPMTIKIR